MVIVILGVLMSVAVPMFMDFSPQAHQASEKKTVGAVRAGIYGYFGENKSYPSSLDSAADGDCNDSNPCFDTVLAQGGITDFWSKSGNVYQGPTGATYEYDSTEGTFMSN